jgi:hypothetical protein
MICPRVSGNDSRPNNADQRSQVKPPR